MHRLNDNCSECCVATSDRVQGIARRLASLISARHRSVVYDPRRRRSLFIQRGEFIVGLHGTEHWFAACPAQDEIAQWLCEVWPALHQPDRYVGCRKDHTNDQYTLTVVTVVGGQVNALARAWVELQDAIYDPSTSKCIPVTDPARRAA